MPPPMSSLSALVEQVVDHAELVGHLRAAEHDGVRALRLLGEPPQHLDLGEHESAGGVREALRDVVDAGLLAVHDAEAVADERVAQRGQLVGERAALGVVLAGLAGVEPDVLEHDDVAVGHRLDRRLGGLADRVAGVRPRRRPSSSPSRAATGASEYAGSGSPLGRPRCAITITLAPRASAGRRWSGRWP